MAKTKADYGKMTTRELAQATSKFDEPMVIDRARPMSAAQRRKWKSATRKQPGGRPRKPSSEKYVRILTTIDPRLLAIADAFAKKKGISRSELVVQGLRTKIGA